ncbi:MAG: Transcriptional regulatory protein DevR (DosR) [Planctomycetes bacterium ADurb.Bin126]|nr:MAG: Transcriptional regulatory protein DevR (DosR) [Planctomycetes bacterium ADurb.Bin126]HOD82160.1 response regulator transcription factor [Phycisphaerae bacterium]HQL72617.1 response regulator transcription factor [Phycisphaerae bacterium]
MSVSGTQPTRILLVDDHELMRQGLSQLIRMEEDFTVCGEAEDVDQAIRFLEANPVDLAIVDISLKDSNGVDLIREIRARWPALPVIVLSMFTQSSYVERAFQAGANAYVTKEEVSSAILDAIRHVLAGKAFVSKSLAPEMMGKLLSGRMAPGRYPVDRLSDREHQIFELIGQGLRTNEIADRLDVSVKTVESHREHIKRKLGIDSAGDLLKYAIEWAHLSGQN